MSTSKPRALSKAATAQRALNAAEEKSRLAGSARDEAALAAQEAGATYADLTEATGLSTPRITQVLRQARTRRPAPTTN